MPAKSPFYMDIGSNKVVRVQLVSASYSAGLKTDLGILDPAAGGDVPAGKTLVGTGKAAAMQNGCFGINLVYAATATRNQTAKVLCAPSKADTVFTDARSETYRSKNILEVRVPRRRVFVF